LPNNVCTEEQLLLLPEECLSGHHVRPLRHVDEEGNESFYHLRPMFYSVIFILLVELLERFSFYGINYTQTSYLTGSYNRDWNADMEAVDASTYVSISVAVAYTSPFLGAYLADAILGDYGSLFVGSLCFYLPGLTLIALTTIPGVLGDTFNRRALSIGLLVLWPVGTGIVKSVVNVFGAKQFHPLLQASMIESYYVKFYMCINIGALVGGVLVPLLAQHNVTLAYFVPVGMLSLGVGLFAVGSKRYVRDQPKDPSATLAANICRRRPPKRPAYTPPNTDSIGLDMIFRISLLIIPFNIAYSQMATTFIVQGTVMEKAFGWIDAACMNNADAVSVLLFGYLIGSQFYPALANRGIRIPTTYKFAIGSGLGALAIAWALLVEVLIHDRFESTGKRVSVLWQTVSYVLIGAGEIFAVSAAYEVAFTAAPPEKKVLASAVNLFCIGGLPNVFCILLYNACRPWFRNNRGTTSITRLEDYASAHVEYYFWLLLAIAVVGIGINLLPAVREFVEAIEEKATDMIKTPKTPSRPPIRERTLDEAENEESALLRTRRHQAYLKYGSAPVLYKQGSMRAGPSLSQRGGKAHKHVKRTLIKKLYRSDPVLPGVGTVITSQGTPVPARFIPPRKNPSLDGLLRATSS
jgi:POT family proton-dependent oligopeptide transporter